MTGVAGILGIAFLFMIGLAFLVPGIVGTIVTSKVKHGPKVLRILSIISMALGIAMCVLAFILFVILIAVAVFNFA